jgi:hypothetical protein
MRNYKIHHMNKPIKGYGALGLILASIGILGAALLIEPLAAQGIVALFGLGVLIRGVRVFQNR